MPVTRDQPAPYAPASAVLGLIERHRNKGLPSPVDEDVLARAGISPSLIGRTLQALSILDLVTEDGKPSDVLEGIRLAPEAEYQQRLRDWLNSAYADALQFVDPETADEIQIRDAFRSYKPVGQQNRMVTLFMGLFAAAGVGPERPASVRKVPVRKPSAQPVARAPAGVKAGLAKVAVAAYANPGLPPALSGLLASLPANGSGWTKAERDRFATTFGAVLDFCYPVRAAEPQKQAADGGVEDAPM